MKNKKAAFSFPIILIIVGILMLFALFALVQIGIIDFGGTNTGLYAQKAKCDGYKISNTKLLEDDGVIPCLGSDPCEESYTCYDIDETNLPEVEEDNKRGCCLPTGYTK